MNRIFTFKATLIVICSSFYVSNNFAQINSQLPFIPEIPQSLIFRPSAFPQNKLYIGIPFLSNLNVGFVNNGLNYHDAYSKTATGAYIDLAILMNQLNSKNILSLEYNFDIISLGYKLKKSYLSFNMSEKGAALFHYSDNLMNFIYKGNGAYIGQTVNLNSSGFDASNYWEFGLGLTRQVSDKLTAGIRVRRIYGLDNVSSSSTNLEVTTDPTDYTITLASDLVINTSGILNNSGGFKTAFKSSNSTINYLFNTKNGGWAINLGVSYSLSKKWIVSADAIDIGSIHWINIPTNYKLSGGNYSYSGVSLEQLLNQSSTSIDYLDSLKDSFRTEKTKESYSTSLHSKLILSSQYQIAAATYGTFSFRSLFFQNESFPSFSLMIRQKIKKHITIDLNYTRQFTNFSTFGGGLVLQFGGFNFFVLSDNLIGTIDPSGSKLAHLNVGFNLCWGPTKKSKIFKKDPAIERY